MRNKAEKRLEEIMDLTLEEKENKKVVADVSKFVAGRLGKEEWSERQEVDHTTKGEKIAPNEQIEALREEFEQKLRDKLAS